MKTKLFLILLVLYIGFSDLIGDLFNEPYYKPPETWLTNTFGTKAVTNSINFYILNNGWSFGPQTAMAITDDSIYLVSPKKNIFQVYEFKPIEISLKSCKELDAGVSILKSKMDGKEIDREFLKNSWAGGLDGPTLTLVRYNSDRKIVQTLSRDDAPKNEAVYIAFKIFVMLRECKSS